MQYKIIIQKFVFLTSIVGVANIYAQTSPPPLTQVIQPSPIAAAMQKYGDKHILIF